MIKDVLKLGDSLSKTSQKAINGGFPSGPLPKGCYCLLNNNPCTPYSVPCDSTCPNGGRPFQSIYPFELG
ncbi:MAG: hypothetical protein AAFQ94_05030 [Bacteroidota bacterium]